MASRLLARLAPVLALVATMHASAGCNLLIGDDFKVDAGVDAAGDAACSCGANEVCVTNAGVTACALSCTTSSQCSEGCCSALTAGGDAAFSGVGACLGAPGAGTECLCIPMRSDCTGGTTCTSMGTYSTCQ